MVKLTDKEIVVVAVLIKSHLDSFEGIEKKREKELKRIYKNINKIK